MSRLVDLVHIGSGSTPSAPARRAADDDPDSPRPTASTPPSAHPPAQASCGRPSAVGAADPGPAAARYRTSIVQVTNLGISVKDSPASTLVFVTRLDNAMPVADAHVSIVNDSNRALWTGTTKRDGVALAPALGLRPRPPVAASALHRHGREGRRVAYVGVGLGIDAFSRIGVSVSYRAGAARCCAARYSPIAGCTARAKRSRQGGAAARCARRRDTAGAGHETRRARQRQPQPGSRSPRRRRESLEQRRMDLATAGRCRTRPLHRRDQRGPGRSSYRAPSPRGTRARS